MSISYPRLAARTLRFTLGIPRNLAVSADGRFVRFVRTPDGLTRTGQLWELDTESGTERLLVDPAQLLAEGEQLSDAEQARRERSRESAAGIVSWSSDAKGERVCFALSGRLFVTDLSKASTRELATPGDVIDPHLNGPGTAIAYASSDGSFRVAEVDSGRELLSLTPTTPDTAWGQAEFIAAEEMDRFRGFWWSPDGEALLVQHTDETPVDVWHIADPANPDRAPRPQRYPAAGTNNARVSLWHVRLDLAERHEVSWDSDAFEYLARVSWTGTHAPIIQVLSRDQRSSLILEVDPETGRTTTLRSLNDDTWLELGSAPQRDAVGRLITTEDHDDKHRVVVDGVPLSSATWQVRSIIACDSDSVVATASYEPTEVHVVRFGHDGAQEVLTTTPGVHSAVVGGDTTVIVRSCLESVTLEFEVRTSAGSIHHLKSVAHEAPFNPQVEMTTVGPHELSAAILFPRDHVRGSKRLPLLLDPYGGPHAQRVMLSARMFMESQWLADQGFCVVVADGRGTPGRSRSWERAIKDEFASVTLADQVQVVEAIAERYGADVDTTRVGITGWSYGGYLAALAVLDRPDVFTAAVAGAPVTDWALYDTCYTERYLGDPRTNSDVYERNSLITKADQLERPLLLIHGLADDNVVAAHTLRLSSALLAAGKPHTVLPLSGVTHMTPQETVAENLKLVQLDFLRRSLGLPDANGHRVRPLGG